MIMNVNADLDVRLLTNTDTTLYYKRDNRIDKNVDQTE